MAANKDWVAVDAAMELLNPKNIKSESVIDIGSRFPLFTKSVLQDGTQALVNILSALPDVNAADIEAGLRGKKATSKPENETKPGKRAGRPKTKKEEPEEEEEDGGDNPYEGKSAKELYTLCKERGLKVKTKQPASEYAKILLENDSKEEEAAAEEEEWEEEPEEEEVKPTKKRAGRPAKKSKPEPEEAEEEEDDDDWEI